MITRGEILKGRDAEYPLTSEMEFSLSVLLQRVNKLRIRWGKPMVVTSGYRPGHYNRNTPGAALKSKHTTCQAVDIHDPNQTLAMWLLNQPQVLDELGLYMEHPEDTRTLGTAWVHLQTVPPASGLRIFRAKPPTLAS